VATVTGRVLRTALGLAVLVAVLVRVGDGPFLRALTHLGPLSIGAAFVLAAGATVAAAWRWRLVAQGFGARLDRGRAVLMYFRSQFVNTVLPGGVLGDVHRAVAHGRGVGDVPAAVRAVAVERTIGQVVQFVVTAITLLVVGVAGVASASIGAVVVVVPAAVVTGIVLVGVGVVVASRRARAVVGREFGGVRSALRGPGVVIGTVLASFAVLVCHVATFAVAVMVVGVDVPPVELVVLALVVLAAAAIPINVGGWGPREGAAGWVFAAVGLHAADGVAAAMVFGVLAMVSLAPGALAAAIARTRPRIRRTPYVVLSSAISTDGYLDDAGPGRLLLSNAADFDRVDALRASVDAILVGASTVRHDDPRLLVKDAGRRDRRRAAGLLPSPWKVTVTASGDLDPDAAFFTAGEATGAGAGAGGTPGPTARLVYTTSAVAPRLAARLGDRAIVVAMGRRVRMADVVRDLGSRGVDRLMVEGGGNVHAQFLGEGLADELRLAVAPVVVADARAPRLVADGRLPVPPDRTARLLSVRTLDEVVVLRYALSDRAALSDRCSSVAETADRAMASLA
jgi:glycosyltransferase 2 family protein